MSTLINSNFNPQQQQSLSAFGNLPDFGMNNMGQTLLPMTPQTQALLSPEATNSNFRIPDAPAGEPGLLARTSAGFKNIFGFGDQKLQILKPEAGMDANQLRTIELNNEAIQASAQQSLAKWNAVGNVLSGVSGIGNLYLGFEQLDLAKDAARLQKKAFETNLANSTRSYNTQLAERRERFLKASGTYSDDALKSYMDEHGI